MPFSEQLKLEVKRKSHSTCCWCRNVHNKVDIHHILPQSEGGPDTEENAAPLCGSCHDLFGGNPDHRKEIRQRRDLWYEICWRLDNPRFGWPIGLDVPLLSFVQPVPPIPNAIPAQGIQITDKATGDLDNPPLLYMSIYFKNSRYFAGYSLDSKEKWLYLDAHMRFAFSLRIQVRADNNRDVEEFMGLLRNSDRKYIGGKRDAWDLHGFTPETANSSSADYLLISRSNNEYRLLMTTFTPTIAAISIEARFTDAVATALADYLAEVGFSQPFSQDDYLYKPNSQA